MKKSVLTLSASALVACSSLYSLNVNAMSSAESAPSGYTETQHPIMLVQGILAFDSIAGVE
jgi:triacylglycerol lipase